MNARVGLLLAAGAVVACSDSFKPNAGTVAGAYTPQTFTSTDSVGTVDWLSAGATLTITLDTNGTTTGHLFMPGAGAGGADIDADLAGTWQLTGDVVLFTQSADTFVRDMPFIAGQNRLAGDQTFSGVRVRLVLTK